MTKMMDYYPGLPCNYIAHCLLYDIHLSLDRAASLEMSTNVVSTSQKVICKESSVSQKKCEKINQRTVSCVCEEEEEEDAKDAENEDNTTKRPLRQQPQ